MSLKLNGATSGSIELDVPAAIGSDVTGVLLPTSAGTLDRLERAGNILQVVQSTFTGTTSTNGSSYVSTGLSATITPTSSNSKVLVMTTFNFGQSRSPALVTNNIKAFSLFRGSSDLAPGNSAFFQHQDESAANIDWDEQTQVAAINFLDSPATTSPTTYSVQMKVDSSAVTLKFNSRGHAGPLPGSSTLILMEVAG